MTLYWGSWRRRSATKGPRKPAAPVMRIFGISWKCCGFEFGVGLGIALKLKLCCELIQERR
jgi:hypothetical protein